MTDLDLSHMSDREKICKILEALHLPEGQHAVGDAARSVLLNEMSETDTLVIYITTALFFHLYETVEGGLIWGLWMPDPADTEHMTDAPIIYTTILGIEIRATFAVPPDQIAEAVKVDDAWWVTK